MTLHQLLTKMRGAVLVVDPVTDATETAESCRVMPLDLAEAHAADPMGAGAGLAVATVTVTDPALIRALYDHQSATAYGDGSYAVRADHRAARPPKRWIPRPGDIITLKGDGDKTRDVRGTVERTSKSKCGPGVVRVWLCGFTDPFIAEDGQIVNHSR